MHFHKILVKMVVINEISAQNNPHTIKFSTQNALQGHKIDFGIHFCTPHIQVDFRPYYISLIPYILFPFQCHSMLNPHFNIWFPFQCHSILQVPAPKKTSTPYRSNARPSSAAAPAYTGSRTAPTPTRRRLRSTLWWMPRPAPAWRFGWSFAVGRSCRRICRCLRLWGCISQPWIIYEVWI